MPPKKAVVEQVDRGLYAWKIIQALVGAFLLLAAVWAQFLGPGIRDVARDFLGVSEIMERLDFVERFMPPPVVAEWDATQARQEGRCNAKRCPYVLVAASTEYGEECGRPIEAQLKLRTKDGRLIRSEFDPNLIPELGRSFSTFSVDLGMPAFLPEGTHQWRLRLDYPTCPGFREPIPRYTPWFVIRFSKEAT